MHYFIDFIITKRCNLNCKYCTSRASICSANCEYDLEQFKKDIDHLFKIGMNFTPVIIGGEPFCNFNIFDYIEYIRSKDKDIPIVIFTNGKYLSTATSTIYNKLHDFNVTLWLTIYNLSSIDYNTVFNKCIEHCVVYRLNGYNTKNIKRTAKKIKPFIRNEMGIYKLCDNNITQNNRLRKCMTDNNDAEPVCVRVFNGILYYGACLPMLSDIDKRFNTNLASKLIENEDYIYIKNITKPEISVKTIKFCKNHCVYCGTEKWDKSKREKDEFIYEY